MDSGMMAGTVRWWNEERGHGFIRGNDGLDYFVHYTCLVGEGRKNLLRDEDVEFEPAETPKGPRATKVLRGKVGA